MGSKSKASNYRPISLTCIASKLLEHILVSNIMSHFDDNNLLSQCHHGFRSEHSCESQLISLRVQRSAARYVCNNFNYTSGVTCMLKSLNWHTLEYRRNNYSLMYFYKIRNALVHVDHHHLISTRNLNYLIPHSNTQYHSNSYFPRTIRLWNSLPGTVQACPSLAIFATRLDAVTF